jgi:aminoglycoside phosphotransferase (APT) family kinase protein
MPAENHSNGRLRGRASLLSGARSLRDKWRRTQAVLEPRRASIEALVRRAFPDGRLVSVEKTFGGLANTNFRLELSGSDGARPVLLRYWQRDEQQAAKEIALLSFVGARVPVPAVLAIGDADPDFGLPFAFMQWIDGERLDALAPRLASAALEKIGRGVGGALAAIHGFAFDRQGFFGADLIPRDGLDMDVKGILAWLDHCLREGPGDERLGADLTDALYAFVAEEGHVLSAPWALQPVLAHSDFDASNILIAQQAGGAFEEAGGAFKIAAILDWEFAFAGGPTFDFGHLLRPPLGDDSGFIEGVCAGYRAARKELPEDWREAARMADLLSWVDFVSQPVCGAAVIKSARHMIGRIIGGAGFEQPSDLPESLR